MPRSVTKQVYTYEELSPEAQDKAREKWLHDTLSFDAQGYMWDPINEFLEEEVSLSGYEKVDWTVDAYGNASVELYGDVDEKKVLPRAGIEFVDPDDVEVWIAYNIRRHGKGVVEVNLLFDEDELNPEEGSIEELEARIVEAVEQDKEEQETRLEQIVRSEVEYLQSAEVIAENIIVNEYEFYEDGSLFRG